MEIPNRETARIRAHFNPRPYSDELLSSYIARVSRFFGVTFYTYCKLVLEFGRCKSQDIDRSLPLLTLDKLQRECGYKPPELLTQSFSNLWSIPEYSFREPSILSTQIRGGLPHNYAFQYCPLCLEEDVYFRNYWRLAFLPVCIKHNILLFDRCPHCQKPISIQTIDPFIKNIGYCAFCWKNLRSYSYLHKTEPVPLAIALLGSIKNGWFHYEGISTDLSLFMDGFWILTRAFYSTRKNYIKRLRRIQEYYLLPKMKLSKSSAFNQFKNDSVLNRYHILCAIDKMLIDWPCQFISFCNATKVTPSTIVSNNKTPPYWLYSVLRRELNRDWYKCNITEFKACIDYLRSNKYEITKENITKHLGVDISKKFNKAESQILRQYGYTGHLTPS
ncbi:TniQ family protein [Pleionea mediterranea]|uniref:TniQ protein n=1 Tax=Pleionea mediterranea TaxID=523701 RepID=A0A316FWZ9_9GAMM|nr:TniQ protein [Pleionea mediterranea]